MKNAIALVFGFLVSVGAGLANAALPAGVATGFTTITTNLQDVFDLALPVVILGVVLTLIMKLIKKFAGKV